MDDRFLKNVKGRECDGIVCTPIALTPTKVMIRAEKTSNFITISLADEKRGLFIQVPYKEIQKLVKGL